MSPSAVESCPRRGTFWDRGIKGGSSRLPLGEERANILLLACCYQEGSNPRSFAVSCSSGVPHLLDRHPQLDPVIDRVHEILLSAKVTLGRLDARVAQHKLNLF